MSRAAATAPASQCRKSAGGSGSIVSGTPADRDRKRPEREQPDQVLLRRQHRGGTRGRIARPQMRRTSAAENGWWSLNAIVVRDRIPCRVADHRRNGRAMAIAGDADDGRRTVERNRPGPAGKAGRRPIARRVRNIGIVHPGHVDLDLIVGRDDERQRRCRCRAARAAGRPAGSRGLAMSSRPMIRMSMSRSSCRCWNPSSSTWTVAAELVLGEAPARYRSGDTRTEAPSSLPRQHQRLVAGASEIAADPVRVADDHRRRRPGRVRRVTAAEDRGALSHRQELARERARPAASCRGRRRRDCRR